MSHFSKGGCLKGMTLRLALIVLSLTACGPADHVEVTASPILAGSTAASSNAPGCPATWQDARLLCNERVDCTLGTSCSYPGVGDQLPDGRWADGLLLCFDQSGGTGDAGVGEWRCAQ